MSNKYKQAYYYHKYSAENIRNIEFLLSFEEWLKIWIDSGHLHERGRKKGQYCMSRFGDKGPYAVGNVQIVLHSSNIREGQLGRKASEEAKQNIRKSLLGVKHSLERRQKSRETHLGKRPLESSLQKRRTNEHGFKGVTRHSTSKRNPWQVRIWFGGKSNYVGVFPSPEEAHKAYVKAEVRLGLNLVAVGVK